jgi:GTP cyclohydrolase FolE2
MRNPICHAAHQQRSRGAFLAERQRFDEMVAELQQMTADHFGADTEQVLWIATCGPRPWCW